MVSTTCRDRLCCCCKGEEDVEVDLKKTCVEPYPVRTKEEADSRVLRMETVGVARVLISVVLEAFWSARGVHRILLLF